MRGPPPSTTGGGAVRRPGGGADRDRRGSAQLLTRLSDNDPVALLSSISEHLVKKHKGRFGTTEALLREVLKKGEHASEAMGVSRMHSKRILEDAGAQPGSRAFAVSAEPEDARAPAGERALASTSYPDAKTPSPAKTPRRKPAALKSPKALPWASDEKEQISEDGLAVLAQYQSETPIGQMSPVRRTQKFLTNSKGDVNIKAWLSQRKQREVKRERMRQTQVNKEVKWIKQLEKKQIIRNKEQQSAMEKEDAAVTIQRHMRGRRSLQQQNSLMQVTRPTSGD